MMNKTVTKSTKNLDLYGFMWDFSPLGWILLAGCACEPLLAKVLSTVQWGTFSPLPAMRNNAP
jgi:hypothetical protein